MCYLWLGFSITGGATSYTIFSVTDEIYALLTGMDAPEEAGRIRLYVTIFILDRAYRVIGMVARASLGRVVVATVPAQLL